MSKTSDSATHHPRTDDSAVELRPMDPGDAEPVAEIIYWASGSPTLSR
jgi:hypothetical protein